jgi:hypothetical protein
VGSVTLLKAPVDQVAQWVGYHLNAGLTDMHLFFDDPADPAADALSGIPGIHTYRCDEAFWQRWSSLPDRSRPPRVPGRQVAILRKILNNPEPPLDWLVHIDSDELLWSRGHLADDLVRDLSGEAAHVQFLPLEAVPADPRMKDAFLQVRLFKDPVMDRMDWARRLGVEAPFRGKRFLRGHVKGKPAVRLDGSVRQMRIHGPTDQARQKHPFESSTSERIRVLHYDAGSFDDWRRKWLERLAHPVGAMSPARHRQESRFERAAASGNDRRLMRLYQREYMLSPRDARILRVLGMVRKIEIPASAFALPGVPLSARPAPTADRPALDIAVGALIPAQRRPEVPSAATRPVA